MRKKWNVLSVSQSQFIEYIKENLSAGNRTILYKHVGHFGLEYAIVSRFKKIEVISLKQLKSKKGKNILFRLINIIFAVIAFILNELKVTDARTTVTSILSNMENIYLGIDKEKEYLKYLHIKKFSHKNGNIHFAIRISENDIETDEDIQCIRLLCKLIKSGKINNTILLITGEKIDLLNLDIQKRGDHIPLFQLNKNDLDIIANENNLKVTDAIYKNIDMVQRLGIQFFIDNYRYFDALDEIQSKTFDWIHKMDWVIKQISQKSEIENHQLYRLLEFSSFFEKYFTKIDIINFNNNQLEAQNLDTANNLAIIQQEKASCYVIPTYSFQIDAFKIYFERKYVSDLEPMPELIYQYFRKHFPYAYIPALKVLQVDSSFVSYQEKQSLTVIAFYFQNIEKGVCNFKDFLGLATKDSTASIIIRLYEKFKTRTQDNESTPDIMTAINNLENGSLDYIATCASYVMILQYLKENYIDFLSISFKEILMNLMSSILSIEDNNNYSKYWKNSFKCQYIALSLEDEDTKEYSAKRFLNDISKVREEENFSLYVKENNLRGFTRIDLLSYSIGYDNAGEILQQLYLHSEESTILKELSRINYSSYLIENEMFAEAEKILKKGNINFLENINIDTYGGYCNNLYSAQFKNKTIDLKRYIYLLEELIKNKISCNDMLIIQNNLFTAYLIEGKNKEKGIAGLKEILVNGNQYNRFLATHNLLSFFFANNDIKDFDEIYPKISIPKLLLSNKTFFLNKFKWMKEHIGQKDYKDFKKNPNVIACYNQLYLIGTIERWFE